jgi:hypothetical protein
MPWERTGSGYKTAKGGFVRNPGQYETLRSKGMSKRRAAMISNSVGKSYIGGKFVRAVDLTAEQRKVLGAGKYILYRGRNKHVSRGLERFGPNNQWRQSRGASGNRGTHLNEYRAGWSATKNVVAAPGNMGGARRNKQAYRRLEQVNGETNTAAFTIRTGSKSTGKSHVFYNRKRMQEAESHKPGYLAAVAPHEHAHAAPKRSGYRLFQVIQDPATLGREEARADFIASGGKPVRGLKRTSFYAHNALRDRQASKYKYVKDVGGKQGEFGASYIAHTRMLHNKISKPKKVSKAFGGVKRVAGAFARKPTAEAATFVDNRVAQVAPGITRAAAPPKNATQSLVSDTLAHINRVKASPPAAVPFAPHKPKTIGSLGAEWHPKPQAAAASGALSFKGHKAPPLTKPAPAKAKPVQAPPPAAPRLSRVGAQRSRSGFQGFTRRPRVVPAAPSAPPRAAPAVTRPPSAQPVSTPTQAPRGNGRRNAGIAAAGAGAVGLTGAAVYSRRKKVDGVSKAFSLRGVAPRRMGVNVGQHAGVNTPRRAGGLSSMFQRGSAPKRAMQAGSREMGVAASPRRLMGPGAAPGGGINPRGTGRPASAVGRPGLAAAPSVAAGGPAAAAPKVGGIARPVGSGSRPAPKTGGMARPYAPVPKPPVTTPKLPGAAAARPYAPVPVAPRTSNRNRNLALGAGAVGAGGLGMAGGALGQRKVRKSFSPNQARDERGRFMPMVQMLQVNDFEQTEDNVEKKFDRTDKIIAGLSAVGLAGAGAAAYKGNKEAKRLGGTKGLTTKEKIFGVRGKVAQWAGTEKPKGWKPSDRVHKSLRVTGARRLPGYKPHPDDVEEAVALARKQFPGRKTTKKEVLEELQPSGGLGGVAGRGFGARSNRISKGSPDMADVHIEGVLRPVGKMRRARVEKGMVVVGKADEPRKPGQWNANQRAGAAGLVSTLAGGAIPLGVGIGAGSAARKGKRFKTGGNAFVRTGAEGGVGGAVGAGAGMLTRNRMATKIGAALGGGVGTVHGANRSIANSRRKGYLRSGF